MLNKLRDPIALIYNKGIYYWIFLGVLNIVGHTKISVKCNEYRY